MSRRCSRPACKQPALYTLTYVYRDSTAVVGPLATASEPHSYDLCAGHAGRLTAPRGWDVVRADGEFVRPVVDELTILAEAVRESNPGTAEPAEPDRVVATVPAAPEQPRPPGSRRAHLRVLPGAD
jgi:hypothetical protein